MVIALRFDVTLRSRAGEKLGNISDSFSSSFAKDDSHSWMKVFGIFDETKVYLGLIARPQTFTTHCQDLRCLANASTMN